MARQAGHSWRQARTAVHAALAGASGLALVAAALAQQPPAKPAAERQKSEWGVTVAPTPEKRPPKRAPKKPMEPHAAPAAPDTAAPKPEDGPPPAEAMPQARAFELSGDARRTRLAIELTARTTFTSYRMADPYRVILDLPAVDFALPQGAGRQGRGLVTAFRYGLFAPGKSRIVIDTQGPVRVEQALVEGSPTGPGARLVIDLIPSTPTEFAADEIAAAAAGVDVAAPGKSATPEAPAKPKTTRAKPVIVIDPGHGGIDSGAQGALGLEKDLVLAVALEIRRSLLASRRYEVVMTRSSDVFLSLDQRVRLSLRHSADLFLSIHADSLAAKELAQHVRGATLYVLSEKASDDRARRMAEKENAADLLAGLHVDTAPGDAQVRTILVDLMRRESATLSSDFRGVLIGQMRTRVALAKDPSRAAPFKVLRQPGSPAVLIELGYISNLEDEKLMTSQTWQRQVASAVAQAVDLYFRRQTARQP